MNLVIGESQQKVFKVGDKVFLKLQPYKSKSQAGLQVLQALSHH